MEKVYLYIANVKDIDTEAVLVHLSETRRARVLRCTDAKKRRQLAASELLCAYALRDLGENVSLPLALSTTQNGKPYLNGCAWEFNVSHSEDIVCCAVASMPIGADVEYMAKRDFEKLSKRFCSEREYEKLHRRPENRLCDCFYEFWVRKEAMVKRDDLSSVEWRKVDVSKWHVCCFKKENYMYAVAANKAFELVERSVDEKCLNIKEKCLDNA